MRSVQALTEAAPTLATEGIALSAVASVIPIVRAPNGQTLTSGDLLAYYYNDVIGEWIRAPRSDEDIDDATGQAAATLSAINFTHPAGRFALIASGVVLSGGSQITIDLIATERDTGVRL